MGIIHVLDKHTANLIAAGEVVERPASAIKELLENSADAKADKITVEIKNGGILFMRITDNGTGMAKDDVSVAVLRHATSKIRDGNDLEAIATLGFRGEALAAICAVSDVKILTKRSSDEVGTLMIAKNGEVRSVEDTGCPDGTTIIVENLFENVPARRKFLKKDFTEASAVLASCEKFALSRPDIAVTVISDGTIKLQTPGDKDLKNTIYASLGREFATKLLPLNDTEFGIRVYGFIGRPEICRPNRNLQNFFVNGRYVKSRTAMAALEQSFHSFCPVGKFPACVLFIELDFHFVDVNIHPAKLEIKFTDEKKIFDTVYFAVKNALSRGVVLAKEETKSLDQQLIPDLIMEQSQSRNPPKGKAPVFIQNPPVLLTVPVMNHNKPIQFVKPSPLTNVFGGTIDLSELKSQEKKVPPIVRANTDFVPNTEAPKTVEPIVGTPLAKPFLDISPLTRQENKTESLFEKPQEVGKQSVPERKFKYIGEAFHAYIIAETEGSLFLIDKHAAHERILYESIKNAKKTGGAQVLLEPFAVSLTPKEYAALIENTEYFEKAGFEFDEFGANTVLLRTYPEKLETSQIVDVFTFLAGSIENSNLKAAGDIFDKALFSAACKAAMKAGQKNNAFHNEWIVEKLFSDEAVLYCPHGRPVLTEFTREKLDKMFGRT